MALNREGTTKRTNHDEDEDANQIARNFLNESWKDWPLEEAFNGLEDHQGQVQLEVKGEIPGWAAGSLFRAGPGRRLIDNTPRGTHHTSHWFDGFSQAHRFDIVASIVPGEQTTVQYSSRCQSEAFIQQIQKQGWRSGISFAQRADPCVGIFAKFMSFFQARHANNSVAMHPDVSGFPTNPDTSETATGHKARPKNLYMTTDFAGMCGVDPNTLEPLGCAMQKVLHPDLTGSFSCAHGQRDPETGDFFNYNLAPGYVPTYRFFRVNAASGTTDILATVSDPELPMAYIHSFFLTESYVVLCIPSSHIDWYGLRVLWERNFVDAIKPFDETKLSRWIVVDRRNGKGVVARFSTPAAFFFHSVNAFEKTVQDENGRERTGLFFDHIMYPDLDIMKGFYYDIILDNNNATKEYWHENERFRRIQPRLVRYQFLMPLTDDVNRTHNGPDYKAKAKETLSIPSPHVGELPTVHPGLVGKPYRYVYSGPNRGLNTVVDCLAKTDLETREALIWSGPKGHLPGEPIYVPRPGALDEDDGVVLSVVVDSLQGKAYLLCLDARTMTEMGRAKADFAIPMGFHGVYIRHDIENRSV